MELKLFGRRVNALRRERRITSEKLSELCGVSSVHIRQIEGGTRQPSLELFVRLCRVLEVSPDYLLQDLLQTDLTKDFPHELWNSLSPAEQALVADLARDVHSHWPEH